MTKFFFAAILLIVSGGALAAERKSMANVVIDALTAEGQATTLEAGLDHFALVWWLPSEFWQTTMAQEPTMSAADKASFLRIMENVSVLGVVQADISPFGSMRFFTIADVKNNMVVTLVNAEGETQRLRPQQNPNPDLRLVLGTLGPILEAAMGNMGRNFHFFVFNDLSANGRRIVDPYETGELGVQLAKRNGDILTARIEFPFDSLFVPRRCPNGKDAHISWRFCPWSGQRLEN